MRNVTVAAVQMKCSKSVEKNIAHAEELVRQAAAKGAEIVLLPELFERPYFCQERRYEYYEYAQTAEENPAVRHFSRVAAELGIVENMPKTSFPDIFWRKTLFLPPTAA